MKFYGSDVNAESVLRENERDCESIYKQNRKNCNWNISPGEFQMKHFVQF